MHCAVIYLPFANLKNVDIIAGTSVYVSDGLSYSMLRLDATTKKRCLEKLFKFQKFSIKQAFFINEIFSSHVKAHTHKKGLFYANFLEFEEFF